MLFSLLKIPSVNVYHYGMVAGSLVLGLQENGKEKQKNRKREMFLPMFLSLSDYRVLVRKLGSRSNIGDRLVNIVVLALAL